ncbi:MAG: PilT/PilU family type 4a pilus ATPase [Pirellulales bacterium]
MATAEQQIFKKIILHNKLMNAETIDRLLVQMPDPEVAVKFLLKRQKLNPKTATKLLTLYQKQLDKHFGEISESHVLTEEAPDESMSADESFDAMFDEILSDGPGSGPTNTAGTVAEGVAESDPDAAAVETLASEDSDAGDSDSATASDSYAPLKLDEDLTGDEPSGLKVPLKIKQEEELPILELDTDDDDVPATQAQSALAAEAQPEASPPAAEEPAKQRLPATASEPPKAGPIDPLAKKILLAAREINASDVHIKSGEIPIVRVAGRLVEMEGMEAIPAERCEAALLSLLDNERQTNFLETNDLDFCYDGGKELGRFRANFMRQHRGMDGIFRLISTTVPSFEELKLPPVVKKFANYKQGIVLVTGPKGCGKTTTLAAIVDLINSSRPEHIITIEDPIEFVHPCKKGHVNQREVGTHTKSFSAALRAALREAPDVIMVGEMRDLETTSLAITAAETGHLVFATLHTPDALRTIDRVLDVFPPKEQGQIRSMISESMRGIVSQLLVPSVDGKTQELAVEVLVNTMAIGNLIREAKTFQLRGIMQTGRKQGMQLMDDALVKLAKAKKVNKEDAIAMASERAQVESELGT